MGERTILKLHANGDFETIGTNLVYVSSNLYDPATITLGELVNGVLYDDGIGTGTTDFMKVKAGTTYRISVTWNFSSWAWIGVTYYGANFNYLREADLINQSPRQYASDWTCPSDTAYIRLSIMNLHTRTKDIDVVVMEKNAPSLPPISIVENSIVVPALIKIPLYRNYFIAKTSVSGYLATSNGRLYSPTEYDRSSDFIAVSMGEQVSIGARYKDITRARPWVRVCYYNASQEFISAPVDGYALGAGASTGNYTTTITIPNGVTYLRVSVNLYDHPTTDVKISVEKAAVATQEYYPSLEDMGMYIPAWARDTGNPISIFPEGIVIKGEVIHSEPELEREPPEPPVNTVLFTDDFNRPDANTLGDRWTLGRGSFAIENNMAKATGGANVSSTAFCKLSHGDNISLSVDVKRYSSESLIFRAKDAYNTVFAQFEGSDLKLKQTINSVTTTLKTVWLNTNTTAIYRVRVELRGPEIKVYVNDTLHITHILNANLNNTLCGFHSWSGNTINGRFDNFKVETLAD